MQNTLQNTPGQPAEQARPRILVVDDAEALRGFLKMLLTRTGYDVETAADVPEALYVLESKRPALVITDVQLPAVSGLELLQRLKGDPATALIPVIVMTAWDSSDMTRQAKSLGADEVLTKPIGNKDLVEAVARQLAKG